MRKLTRYLVLDFLGTFAVAMLLITFAMIIGAIYQAIEVMARGIAVGIVGRFFIYNIPYTLSCSIPISALFSSLLLFGRLSSDSELNAMKSSGLSLWQIASPILLIAIGLSAFCVYNNGYIFPATEYANRKLIKGMGVEDPIKLLDEGRFIREFPGYMIYVGKKRGSRVSDLVVYEVDKKDGSITSSVRAGGGLISIDKEKAELRIDLEDVRIEVPDAANPDDATKTRYINAKAFPIRLDFTELLGDQTVKKKRRNMTLPEMLYRIRNMDEVYPLLSAEQRKTLHSRYMVDMHKRLYLAVAPITFVLIAIPLGIRSHRKESSIGMLMSLGIVFFYYLFILIADSLDTSPHLMPWLIPWVAIVCAQIAGLLMIRRAN